MAARRSRNGNIASLGRRCRPHAAHPDRRRQRPATGRCAVADGCRHARPLRPGCGRTSARWASRRVRSAKVRWRPCSVASACWCGPGRSRPMPACAGALAQLGLPMRGGDGITALAVPVNAAGEPSAALNVRDYTPTQPLAVLASDARQRPYAWWRAAGEGRIGVTTLTDSYRLPLAGDAGSHGRWRVRPWLTWRAHAAARRPTSNCRPWRGRANAWRCGVAEVRTGSRPHAAPASACSATPRPARAPAPLIGPRKAGWHVPAPGRTAPRLLRARPSTSAGLVPA